MPTKPSANKYWRNMNLPIGMYRQGNGFWCNFSERGERYQKWFGDKRHGGEFDAWAAACEWLRAARKRSNSWWKTAVRP